MSLPIFSIRQAKYSDEQLMRLFNLGTEQYKSIFAPSEAADIKSVMQEYGEITEIQKAVGEWLCGYAEHR